MDSMYNVLDLIYNHDIKLYKVAHSYQKSKTLILDDHLVDQFKMQHEFQQQKKLFKISF